MCGVPEDCICIGASATKRPLESDCKEKGIYSTVKAFYLIAMRLKMMKATQKSINSLLLLDLFAPFQKPSAFERNSFRGHVFPYRTTRYRHQLTTILKERPRMADCLLLQRGRRFLQQLIKPGYKLISVGTVAAFNSCSSQPVICK